MTVPLSERTDGVSPGTARPTRVLVVDDSASFLDFLEQEVRRWAGPDVTVARSADGEDALEQIARCPPDLILLDLEMPGIGGVDVLRRLRGGPGRFTIVVVTTHAATQYRQQCIALGAHAFLEKRRLLDELDPTLDGLFDAPRPRPDRGVGVFPDGE